MDSKLKRIVGVKYDLSTLDKLLEQLKDNTDYMRDNPIKKNQR